MVLFIDEIGVESDVRVAVTGDSEAIELERWLCARKFAELAEAAGGVCMEVRERCKMRKGKAAAVAAEVDLPALIAVRREIDGSEPEMKGAAFLVGEPVALQRICEGDEERTARSGEGAEIGRIVVAKSWPGWSGSGSDAVAIRDSASASGQASA